MEHALRLDFVRGDPSGAQFAIRSPWNSKAVSGKFGHSKAAND
jgi:hypothetical protein